MEVSYTLAPGEELERCPYDQSHVILKARLKVHLERCRRNYLKNKSNLKEHAPMGTCRYHENHVYPLVELLCHEKYCPQKIEQEMMKDGDEEYYRCDPDNKYGILWATFDWEEEVKRKKAEDKFKAMMESAGKRHPFDGDDEDWLKESTGKVFMMPPGTGDIRFAHQRLGKAEKKQVAAMHVKAFREKLETRQYKTKFLLEPPDVDVKDLIDPEVTQEDLDFVNANFTFPVRKVKEQNGTLAANEGITLGESGVSVSCDDSQDDGSDTETLYEDAAPNVANFDLEEALEDLVIGESEGGVNRRFASFESLSTSNDFDDFRSCVSFGDEDAASNVADFDSGEALEDLKTEEREGSVNRRFTSFDSLSTCSDLDDFKSCLSFGGEEE